MSENALVHRDLRLTGRVALRIFDDRLEIWSPGSLKLHLVTGNGDTLCTSEYSPVEIIQPGILVICGLLFAWVANNCPSQRPIAITFGGIALVFAIRELDYFLDRFVADNFWQLLIGVIAAPVIAYLLRHRRRFRIAKQISQ